MTPIRQLQMLRKNKDNSSQKSRRTHKLFLNSAAVWDWVLCYRDQGSDKIRCFLSGHTQILLHLPFLKPTANPKGIFTFSLHRLLCYRAPTGGNLLWVNQVQRPAGSSGIQRCRLSPKDRQNKEQTSFWNHMNYVIPGPFLKVCDFPPTHFLKSNQFQARKIKILPSDSISWKLHQGEAYNSSLLLTPVLTVFYNQFKCICNLQLGKGPVEPSSHSRKYRSEEKDSI